jgi:hypothetical protein
MSGAHSALRRIGVKCMGLEQHQLWYLTLANLCPIVGPVRSIQRIIRP